MRAAAILRPGSVSRAIVHFQRLTGVEWISLLEKPDVAVLFGGDGTIHWHLAELVDLGVPLLVIPCGSGNDFARSLGIRSMRDSAEAFRRFENDGSTLRSIDLLLPFDQGGRLAELHEMAGDLDREDTAEGVRVRGRVPATVAERFARFDVSKNGAVADNGVA